MRNDDALTADEVARLLQVSRSSVYKLVKADELASYHVGRKMRFTMGDVENYIARSKRAKTAAVTAAALPCAAVSAPAPAPTAVSASRSGSQSASGPFVLAGNDIVGDILANYLGATNTAVDRIYEGSYNALVDLYRGEVHAALTHLYDGETDSYNVAAVKRLLPGVPLKVVRLDAPPPRAHRGEGQSEEPAHLGRPAAAGRAPREPRMRVRVAHPAGRAAGAPRRFGGGHRGL